jgi:hypothetical protein
MVKKFFVPAVTMLAGVLVWVVFLVSHRAGGEVAERSLWFGCGLCLVAGGLVAFSAVRCRQVRGPRAGNIVRTILLVVMTAITYWKAGMVAAGGLALAAIATGALTLRGQPQQLEESDAPDLSP